jgi:hypothetical protein
MSDQISSAQDIVDACDRALRLAPTTYPPTLPASSDLLGAPDWYPFERDAWPIGEDIRQAFIRDPKLKKNDIVMSRLVDVATCRNLRRGRQSFIMALGFVGAREHAARLAESLNDDDVAGQVLDTLLKMKAPGFSARVRPLLQARHAWIRRLAQRYVERYSKGTD